MKSVYRMFVSFLVFFLLVLPAVPAPAVVTESDACRHQWEETARREPTCTKAGWVRYKCTLCKKAKKETLPALGHDYERCTIIRYPTCTEDGILRCYCRRDDSHYYDTPLPASGHSWGEWRQVKTPSYTEHGAAEHICSVCGAVGWQRVPMLAPESGAFLLRMPVLLAAADLSAQMEARPLSLVRQVTLFNAGTEALSIREYSFLPDQAPQPLEPTVALRPGEAVTFPLTVVLSESSLMGADPGRLLFRFYAEIGNTGRLCSSNAVSMDLNTLTGRAGAAAAITAELSWDMIPASCRAGDTISVRLQIAVSGVSALPELILLDQSGSVRLSVPALPPGDNRALSAAFTVSEEDIAAGLLYRVFYVWEAGTEKDGPPLTVLPPVAVPVLQ